MRVDIFLKNSGQHQTWRLYVESVTLTNAKRMAATFEAQGEKVALFKHAKCLGKQVYETPSQ